MPQYNLDIYSPSDWQLAVHQCPARYRILVSGRRAGKSMCTSHDLIYQAINEAPAGSPFLFAANVWPETHRSYDNTRAALERIELQAQTLAGYPKPSLKAKSIIYAGEEKSRFRLNLANGTYVEFKSGQEPDNLRGPGYYELVLDEFSEMSSEVWDKVLRPTLAERRGKALISGTPKGRGGAFWRLFQMGNHGNLHADVALRDIPGIPLYSPSPDPKLIDPEYQSFHFPTWANPLINDAEMHKLKKDMSELAFKQEMMAEFLEEGSGVFRNIRACMKGEFEPPRVGERYILGYDPARKRDFAAMGIMSRERRHVVWWKIVNGMTWPQQLDLVEREARKYHAKIVMDSTGLGDPVSQMLQHRGLIVEDVKFANISKQQLIENAALMLEHGECSYPEACEMLVDQLEKYAFTVTALGRIQYSAPSGENDDAVTALCLMCWGVRNTGQFLFAPPEVANGKQIVELEKPKTDPQLGWKLDAWGRPYYPATRDPVYRTPTWMKRLKGF